MKAIYLGSFSPIHNGHIEIIKYISSAYDEVIIFIANNEETKYSKTLLERADLIKKVLSELGLKNIKLMIQKPGDLMPKIAFELNIETIVRRALNKDLNSYERDLSEKYLDINDNLIFNYVINYEYKFTTKELIQKIKNKEDIRGMVPEVIRREIQEL